MKKNIQGNQNIIIYQNEKGDIKLDVNLDNETVWLTQEQMARLFGKDRSTITEHIKNIFEEGELDEKTSVGISHESTGGRKPKIYNLDVIISVGYRVKSLEGVRFRKWATERIKEYIIKGYTIDDERLKNLGGGNYFNELLNRIKDIRTSEKVLYRQVLDLYATSLDYNPTAKETIEFFKIVQNKFHYAAHGHTAAEVVYDRIDSNKPFLGLTSFSGELPSIKDIKVAKNYLNEDELKLLNNLVSGYFDFAEFQAMKHKPMYMKDYLKQLDKILESLDADILIDSGKVSHKKAMIKAEDEYRKYQVKTLTSIEEEYLKSINQLNGSIKQINKGVN